VLAAAGLKLSLLDGELSQLPALLVLGLELIDRMGGRLDACRVDRLQERVDHGAFKSSPADRLARPAGPLAR
jgi:hypothetical protein